MKLLLSALLAITLLFSTSASSQTWQHVGTPGSIESAIEMDFVIAQNGEMYVFYRDDFANTGTVKKWNGTSWQGVGMVGFVPSTASDIKIEAMNNGTPVISYKQDPVIGTDRIKVFAWNGTTWIEYGDTPFLTDLSKPYDLTIDDNNQVSIAYYNLPGGPGSNNEHIWLDINPSGQSVVGTILSGNITNTISIAKSETPFDYWELHGEYDLANWASFQHFNGSSFSDPLGGGTMHAGDGILTSEAEIRNVDGSDKFVAIYKEDLGPNYSTFIKYYDAGTDSYSAEYTHASLILESDMTVSSDGFVYTMDEYTGYGITKIDLSDMTGFTYANAFTPTPTIDNPRIDTENGVLVVAWINQTTNEIEVWEEVIVPSATSNGDITVCSETNYSTADTLFTISGNYDYSAETYSVSSNNNAVINSGSITVLGVYPNFSLQFQTEAVTSSQVVELTLSVASGAGLSTEIIYVNVTTPEIVFSVPDSMCINEGPLLLNPLASPSGGVWSGNNVVNNKLFMSGLTPGSYDLIYTVTDTAGCSGSDTSSIVVLYVPILTVTTTLATCGNEDGTAEVDINTGDAISNYDVYWSNGESDLPLIENLSIGSYFVYVTDEYGCSAVGQASINSNEFTVTESITEINCHGDLVGAIDLTITGTTGPYTTIWSNGQLTEDLTNLGAGVYDITITDINGCQAVHAYTIDDPGQIFANIETIIADCGLDNGSLETFPVGGTAPLTHQWFDSGNTFIDNINLIENLGGGMYYIITTDANGCAQLQNVALTETGGPVVIVDSVITVSCVNTGSIFTTINSTAAIASINWSNGATTEDITGLATGFYAIQVEDVNTCIGMASGELINSQPEDQLICMVTVDETTNTNRVVWEKPVTTDISHFNIYRETSVLGDYQFLDSVLYADESFFNDTIASPQIKSWRYKISAVDLCGIEGELSDIHKTIHLVISQGLGGLVNLSWDDYEGFTYPTFDIWRNTTLSGWVPLTSLASNSFSYTDDPGTFDGLEYYIAITPPLTCTSTKATDYNSSRSNKADGIIAPDGSGLSDYRFEFNLYPNPTTGIFTVEMSDVLNDYQIFIIDLTGKIVYEAALTDSNSKIDVDGLAAGSYTVKLISGDIERQKILIKQ